MKNDIFIKIKGLKKMCACFCPKGEGALCSFINSGLYNQVDWACKIIKAKEFVFKCQDFNKTISEASPSDIIYCDPPYIGRHVDYYNGWDDSHERELFDRLSDFEGKFILSTWHHNDYRENEYIKTLWAKHSVLTREHFYHVGGKETHRNPVVEALVTNFNTIAIERKKESPIQYSLFETQAKYGAA